MGYYTILRNSSLDIELIPDYQDNGWSFSNGIAIHSKYNEGSIRNKVFRPDAGKEYIVKIQVTGITEGFLDVYLGGSLFARITSPGLYELEGTTITDEGLVLTAGLNDVQVFDLVITEGLNEGITIVYDSNAKQFNGLTSFNGDMMQLFLDDLISFKDGVPWVHDSNDTRNSFYGETFPSVVKFYCNVNYDNDKDFYTITLNGNHPWRVEVVLPPRKGKSIGQRSRIKIGNYQFHKGKYVADFLRDMNDPRFSDELQALMKGAYLQGQIMEITLTSESTDPVELMSVEIEVSIK